MFTGIIHELGTVARIAKARGVVRLEVSAPRTASRVQRLESIAINGVCLTVVDVREPLLVFEMIPETQRLTALGTLRSGEAVHVEPSLSVTDRLGGHILFGHVDGLGTVTARSQRAGELIVTVRVAPALRAFLVAKGPIALDGVSLTVGTRLTSTTFRVHLIPETQRQTTLAQRPVGARLNVELDYLAKLVRHFLHRR